MRRSSLAVTVLLAACGFDGGVRVAVDGAVGSNDGAVSDGDGSPDPLCGYTFDPAHYDPCADPMPTVSVTINSANVTFDTDSRQFTPSAAAASPATSVIDGVLVVWTQDFEVSGSLRVVGSLPVLFAANGDIDISGTLDVSSSYDGIDYALGAGASSDAAACTDPPEAGVKCLQHGASGGGGGGFGTAGGQGDHGAAARDCGDSAGKPPTAGGLMVPTPTTIRAGCAGAKGSDTDDGEPGGEGFGGPGGGAVHLTARQSLTISGTVHAGGGGGGPATRDRASGGGGGSGGYIGLESRVVTLTDSAVLAANGGGGGGGSDGASGSPGEDGKPSLDVAQGGGDGGGDPGNDGGVRGTLPEDPGTSGDRGGGGGGGAVGYILFYLRGSSTLDADALITPGGVEI